MHFHVVKFRSIKIITAMLVVTLLLTIPFGGTSGAAAVFFGNTTRKVPVYSVETDKKQVAISFDAAWGADKTRDIMATLKEYNANATFFLVGFWVDKYGDIVKEIHDAGFEIGTHSNTHPDFTKLSKEQMKSELSTSIELIEKITSTKVELFRPPYGAYNNTMMSVCEEMKLIPIQWDVDSLDWKGISAQEIVNRVVGGVKNGSIILCHNNADHIVDALPFILDRLQKDGYEITSIGQLVYKENYEIDRNGMQKLIKK